MYRILLLIILLILYGSFYPWNFDFRDLPHNPLWMLLHSWPAGVDRFIVRDICVNIALYVPLGMFGALAFAQRRRLWLANIATILLALALSSSVEMLQLFAPHRECSGLDVVTNVFGAAAGVLLAGSYRDTLRSIINPQRTEKFFHPNGALLLLYCWLGWQLFPCFPSLSRYVVHQKIAALFAASRIEIVPTLSAFVQWLAIAKILQTIVGVTKTRLWMAALLLLLPLKLLIADRTFTLPELIGACIAFFAWPWLPDSSSLLAGSFVFMLGVAGLSPYRFQSYAAIFSWIPFQAFLASGWISSFVTLLRKSFLYGAAIWLLKKAGLRPLPAAICVCTLLAIVEVAQIHLPGRTPEITDPLLAAIMALILQLVEGHQRPNRDYE